MRYILDTNVVSELRKIGVGKADLNVAKWADLVIATDLYVSVVTLQELEIGVLRAERRDPAQGAMFRRWLDESVLPSFDGRILPVNKEVALRSAKLHVPDLRPFRDGLIAGTALVHDMTIVTRNIRDFVSTGATTLNPWTRL